MEFTITRELFLPLLENMCLIGKNGRKTFEQTGQLSIKAEKDKKRLLLFSSNGYIKALQEVKDEDKLSVIKDGECVVSADFIMKLVKHSDTDSRVKIKSDGKNLLRDIVGQKRRLKIPIFPENPSFKLAELSGKTIFTINKDLFKKSVEAVCPNAGNEEYKPAYNQLFIQFNKQEKTENIFVCGDGEKFAIVMNGHVPEDEEKEDSNKRCLRAVNDETILIEDVEINGKPLQIKGKEDFITIDDSLRKQLESSTCFKALLKNKKVEEVDEEQEEKQFSNHIVPALQAMILADLLNDTKNIKIIFSEKSYHFLTDSGLSASLEGTPLEFNDYVPYRMQLNRFENRIFSFELDNNSLCKIVSDLEAVEDTEYERRHNAIPITLLFKADETKLTYQSSFTNEIDCSIPLKNFNSYGSNHIKFSDTYALKLFRDILKFGNSDQYELSFLGEGDIVFVKFLDDDPSSKRILFFAPVSEIGE